MTIRICVSILPKNLNDAKSLIEKAENSHIDLIEVRLDNIESGSLNLLSTGKTPKIATNRSTSITETGRQRSLFNAAKAGFEYVDLDIRTPDLTENINELARLGAKSIVSFHEFSGTLDRKGLNKILERQIDSKAEVCKIVTTARKVEDNLPLLEFTSEASAKAKLVCFAMGKQGKISRLLSPLFGAFFTFASLDQKSETAPGQMTIREMRTAYRSLGATTR